MSKNYKNAIVYFLIFGFFVLTPYWALGSNLSTLENEQSLITQENSALYKEIELRKEIYKSYEDTESIKTILENNLAKYNNPSLIIENLTKESVEKGLTVSNISQIREDITNSTLEKWVTDITVSGSEENAKNFIEQILNKPTSNANVLKDLTIIVVSDNVYSVTISLVSFLEK